MSTVNSEISRRFTELFSTGDEALAEAVLSPDLVFHGTASDRHLHGIDAMKRFVAATAARSRTLAARSRIRSPRATGW